jgi:ElaB/YqjD/DUF883 family membrane-anchored ribosome-binding protein
MSAKTSADAQTLSDELEKLRADLMQVSATVRDILDHTSGEVRHTANTAVDAAWSKAKRTVGAVTNEIDEKPVSSALIALGVGVALGAILFGRRS